MEFTPFVALRSTANFMFTRTELSEIFCRFGNRVGEKVHFDTAKWFT